MSNHIATGPVHHMTLTVTDLERSAKFYSELLGFQKVADLGPTRIIMANKDFGTMLALGLPPDPSRAIEDDVFNENRVGLDHVSLNVGTRNELDAAGRLFDEHGVSHGEVKDLGEAFGICVMAFRDPDNIQLELTAPRE